MTQVFFKVKTITCFFNTSLFHRFQSETGPDDDTGHFLKTDKIRNAYHTAGNIYKKFELNLSKSGCL